MAAKQQHRTRQTKEPVDSNGLTAQQEQFCQAYLLRFNISKVEKDLSLTKGTGNKWMQSQLVRDRIHKIRLESGKAFDVTRERLLQELMNIVYSSPKNLIGEDIVVWPDDEVAAVASIEYDILGGIKKVTRWDKLKAIEMLNKMLGYNMPETTKNLNVDLPISKEEVVEIAKQLKDTIW